MKEGILLCFHGTKSNEGVKDTNKLLKTFKKENFYLSSWSFSQSKGIKKNI